MVYSTSITDIQKSLLSCELSGVQALIAACQGAEEQGSQGGQYDEDAGVFFLELLVKVVLQNRDRVTGIWTAVRDHLYWVFVRSREPGLLVERAAVGLLRMAIRLLRREEMAGQVSGRSRELLVCWRFWCVQPFLFFHDVIVFCLFVLLLVCL